MPPRFDFLPLLTTLLTRLVRIALSCGVPYQAFNRLLRRIYFEVGSDFEKLDGKPNSDSRIALLTGLPRRELRALREKNEDEVPDSAMSVEMRVLERWSSSLDLLDANGRMLPLPKTIRKGGARSLEALVASVSTDVRSRALLDEWLRKGNVILDDEDRVVPVAHARYADTTSAARIIGHVMQDMLAGFDRRYVAGPWEDDFFLPTVTGHRLSDESVRLLSAQARNDMLKALAQINRAVVEREALDACQPAAQRRFTFSAFIYHVDQRSEPGLLDVEPAVAPAPPDR